MEGGVNTQRTTLASDDPAVVALQIIDDWDESDRAKVNVIAGQAGVDGGSGVVSAKTQRVALATDVSLPAGTNVIGALSANQSVNVAQVGGVATNMGVGAVSTGTQRVVTGSTSMQAAGSDATGQDTFATIVTPSANASHVAIFNAGPYSVTISLDAGTTNHLIIPGSASVVVDDVTIVSGTDIQAKNTTAGLNYSNLSISIW